MRFKYLIFPLVVIGLNACGGNGSQSEGTATDSDIMTEEEVAVVAPEDTFSYRGYNMVAEILAGKAPEDAAFMTAVTGRPGFATHKREMTKLWDGYRTDRIDKMRQWSKQNLPAGIDTVFYPFAGPDFNHLSSFFPDVRYSVLIGIEQPGKIPFTDAKSMGDSDELLKRLRSSIGINLRSSFFRTVDMAEDLNSTLQGTLPVVLMFMSLHGYEIITANPVTITGEGKIEYTEPDKLWAHTLDKKFDKGFEVLYRLPGESGARRLVYLGTDLSNSGFDKAGIGNMVAEKFKGKTTFLKAASYLLQNPPFSKTRDAILANCDMVVNGPSGIAYGDFDKSKWDITLYGTWSPVIPLFKAHPQDDLKEAYKHNTKTNPINFRYDYGTGSNFFVAKRK